MVIKMSGRQIVGNVELKEVLLAKTKVMFVVMRVYTINLGVRHIAFPVCSKTFDLLFPILNL